MFDQFLPIYTILRREVSRFWSIKRQTILGPLLETSLFITVFGASLGSRINQLEGVSYILFIFPGLLMMSFAMNVFSNNSSSILQQKFQKAIDDQLTSPIPNVQLFLGYALGGFVRSCIIAVIIISTASVLIPDFSIAHPLMLIASLTTIGLFFAFLGVLIGLNAEKFDDISFYQTFILSPMIFLGGVFYSATLLPEPFKTLILFNPIYYMVNTVRYAILGNSQVNPWLCIGVVTLFVAGLYLLNSRLFNRGYKLRT
ncbi:ABC transporter [Candidatus Saccharibacteria bacterium RIFCSPHIGHO2_12_FULL_41_12]|nr:MAG: ABC transporter [Candidatus Saccharibacteria bacterium RIFCSPHIGHO2_12_FULL_41_12]